MRAIELIAEVDAQHGLQIALPPSVLPGKVRVIVLTPESEEDDGQSMERRHIGSVESGDV